MGPCLTDITRFQTKISIRWIRQGSFLPFSKVKLPFDTVCENYDAGTYLGESGTRQLDAGLTRMFRHSVSVDPADGQEQPSRRSCCLNVPSSLALHTTWGFPTSTCTTHRVWNLIEGNASSLINKGYGYVWLLFLLHSSLWAQFSYLHKINTPLSPLSTTPFFVIN